MFPGKDQSTDRPPLTSTLASSSDAKFSSLDYHDYYPNYYQYNYGLDYELSYDAEAFANYTQDHNTDFPPLGNLQYLRITWSTLFSGIYFSLLVFALKDLHLTQKYEKNIFLKLTLIFASKLLIDVTEYFIYYDFYFFQSIDYINYGQAVSYFLEFARLVKRTMVFALGVDKCIHLTQVTTRGNLSSSLITWLIFASVTLFFPTTSLIVRASQNHPLLMNFFEIIMIPFAASLVIAPIIYVKAKRHSMHFTHEEVRHTKLVLSYMLIILIESLEFFVVTEIMFPFVRNMEFVFALRDCLHDVNRLFYPGLYLAFFCRQTVADNAFPALNNQSLVSLGHENLNGAGFPRIITNDDFDTEMSAIIYEENH